MTDRQPMTHGNAKWPAERDLVALADGSLSPARRAAIERAVAASPELQASLAAQLRALTALELAADGAPRSLRAQLALMRDRRPRRRDPQRLVATFGAGVAVLAGLLIVFALAIGGGEVGSPTVADAAMLATRRPVTPVPEPPSDPVTLPRLQAAGLPYPYLEDRFGFKALGARRDRLGARFATTVFYARAGWRIAYTIISGPALAVHSGASTIVIDGTRLRSFNARGRRVVTWLRRGHTCVLSGARVPPTALLRLATWTDGGDIPQ